MTKKHLDINDDEIRIISSNDDKQQSPPAKKFLVRGVALFLTLTIFIVALAAVIFVVSRSADSRSADDSDTLNIHPAETVPAESTTAVEPVEVLPARVASVIIADTTVNDFPFTLFTPIDATPSLHIGSDILSDSTVVFAVQAADIRRDNGGIVGAFVDKGQLVSRGSAKSGFCAIIDGKPIIGVANATPYLEEAIEKEGYFFRQYPLVVANQIVENKPQGRSLRKALADIDGRIIVVMSRTAMTLHDFSAALAEMGVTNAIYLVGSSAYGFAIDGDKRKIEFGTPNQHPAASINYIVWR